MAYESLTEEQQCLICGFESDSMAKLGEHVKIGHLNLQNLSCRACHLQFTELPELIAHVRREHTKININKTCLVCKTVFPTKEDFEEHKKLKHNI